MKFQVTQNKNCTKSKGFTIRLEFILLILEILKLQGFVDTSWLTILLWFIVPLIIGRFIKFYGKRYLSRLKSKSKI